MGKFTELLDIMANKVNTVEKTALEIMAEKMAAMETMRLEMEKMKASMLTERESVLPGLKAERATLASRLAELDKAISVFEPVIVSVKKAGRPPMTDEEKAAAKLARENAKKSAEAAQVLGVLKGEATPSNVVNIPTTPAPVETMKIAAQA